MANEDTFLEEVMDNLKEAGQRIRAPRTYLVFGSRGVPDLTHYPVQGEILHDFDDGSWRLQRTDGTLIKEGRES